MAKLAASKIAKISEELDRRCRVQRPNVVTFLLGGDFGKLPKVSTTVLDSPYQRWKQKQDGKLVGWKVPDSDLGRKQGQPSLSTAESVRLWIKQNLGDHVSAENVAVIFEPDDDAVVIYRKG